MFNKEKPLTIIFAHSFYHLFSMQNQHWENAVMKELFSYWHQYIDFLKKITFAE